MTKRPVEYPGGIPRWFTYLYHSIRRRYCLKQGHEASRDQYWCEGCMKTHAPVCDHCGQILGRPVA